MAFGFVVSYLVRSWQLLECFLTKKILQPKTSKRATLVLSAKPLPLYSQPNHAKLKEDSLKRRVRMEIITQNQKFGYQFPHFFLPPSVDWSKQWSIIPFTAPWRISTFCSILQCAQYKEGWIVLTLLSSRLPSELLAVRPSKRWWSYFVSLLQDTSALCYHF